MESSSTDWWTLTRMESSTKWTLGRYCWLTYGLLTYGLRITEFLHGYHISAQERSRRNRLETRAQFQTFEFRIACNYTLALQGLWWESPTVLLLLYHRLARQDKILSASILSSFYLSLFLDRAAFDNVGRLVMDDELNKMLSEVGGPCNYDNMIKVSNSSYER